MDFRLETYEHILAGLEEECRRGRLRNRTDSSGFLLNKMLGHALPPPVTDVTCPKG